MSTNGHHPDTPRTNGRDPLRADEWLEARHAATNDRTSPFARGRSTQSPPPPNNFDVIPVVRSVEPMKDIRRDIAKGSGEQAGSIAQPVA